MSGDQVLTGSNDHFLYALDLQTGQEIWKQNLGQRILSRPLVEADAVYVGVASGYFFALNPEDGRILWKFKTEEKIQYDACADDEGIYFGSDDTRFRKLNRKGELLWEYDTNHRFWGNCVIKDDLVFTSSWDTYFYALNRSTGEVVWKVSSELFNYGGPVLNGNDVYFSSHEKTLRIEAKTGRILSRVLTSTQMDHPVVNDGFLWTNEEGLTKRTLEGEPLGTVKFTASTNFKPVAGRGFLVQANFNRLVAVSTDLKVLWEYEAKDDFWSPGVLHNNVYYTGNRDGNVYALRLP